uniref:uncharacterized protein LOC105350700 isoform X2 n=1 Tax=Fragaria vesca subsp. vesca TaxID=101020 RepID=UPI0005C89256|nr:PREDICTED: uncharacterized protein LOC105350700 isoform X2 [Fragaria vesca subsp. vesca]
MHPQSGVWMNLSKSSNVKNQGNPSDVRNQTGSCFDWLSSVLLLKLSITILLEPSWLPPYMSRVTFAHIRTSSGFTKRFGDVVSVPVYDCSLNLKSCGVDLVMPQDKDVFASKEAMVYGDTNRRISEDDEGDEELEDDLLSSEDDQDLEQDYLFSEDNCYLNMMKSNGRNRHIFRCRSNAYWRHCIQDSTQYLISIKGSHLLSIDYLCMELAS